jgi:hypothetical protein
MELTTTRLVFTLKMAGILLVQSTCALGRRSSSYSR